MKIKKYNKHFFASMFLLIQIFCVGSAQKLGGEYDVTLKKTYCFAFKDSINWLFVEEPDSIPYADPNDQSIGLGIPINRNFFELATKRETANGEYIFLLRVTQEKAIYTMFFFNEFNLPEGPEITFLDTNGIRLDTNKYPAYDFEYNLKESEKERGTWNVPPDVIIKFTCKKDELQKCILHLEAITYGYKNFWARNQAGVIAPKSNLQVKSSQSCDFSIPCFNDYINWFNEINSVVRIEYWVSLGGGSGFWYRCSGVFLNTPDYYNNDDSRRPFVLTAAHMLDTLRVLGQNVNSVLQNSTRIYLLYQKTSCGGSAANPPSETKGLSIIFEGQRSNGDDFANDYLLLQLRKSDISDLMKKGNVTFAGYDANSKTNYQLQESIPAYCFHHPSQDGPDKKYMEYNTIYNNADGYYTYYHEDGFTERGSSGSPVFDINHRLIGLVCGGDYTATCTNQNDPVGPKFSCIFSNISQYLGAECITYSYDPIYAHPPEHCGNCSLDAALGEVEVDCGGPCKPCGQWYEENVSIDNERLLANVIQAKTVTTTSGNSITLKSGKTSNIFFSESLTLNAGFSVEQGADFSLNTKSYSEPINQVCESMCAPAVPHMICEGHSWFCIAPNTTWVTVKIYQANASRTSYTRIYEDSFQNFSNNKITLWDGLTGVRTGVSWDNSRQYIIELQLQDCEGIKYSINFNDGWFLAFTTSGCNS